MPKKPLNPCRAPRCPKLTEGTYCDEHAKVYRKKDTRPSAYQRGYNKRWYKEKSKFLKIYPYCIVCGDKADTVDHKIPHKGNQLLFWNPDNWQPMCKSCHSKKTATEDGGFGNS